MPVVVVIASTVSPIRTVPVGIGIPRITPVRIRIPGIAPVRIPAPIGSPIGSITPSDINAGIIIPIEGVVAIHIDVCVATIAAIGVIVIIIIS